MRSETTALYHNTFPWLAEQIVREGFRGRVVWLATEPVIATDDSTRTWVRVEVPVAFLCRQRPDENDSALYHADVYAISAHALNRVATRIDVVTQADLDAEDVTP